MQLTSRYLVKNQTTLLADMAGFITEYRPVYNRQLNLYKGIDNVLDFRVLNADQKPVDIQSYIPVIMIFDESNTLVVQRDCTVQDVGTAQTKGKCTVTITENDLLNHKQQYLKYAIHLSDSNNQKILTYSDSYFENKGTMYLNGEAMPAPKEPLSVETFTETQTGVWSSDALSADPGLNGNEALHTAVIYTNGFTGNITVQATLENQITGSTTFFDVETVAVASTDTTTSINFRGVFSYVRFTTDASPTDKVTQILYRS